MQRYELVEGTSSKFWEVEVDGSALTVRFGRIGTAGQTRTKTFDSADAARRERDQLVKEKTGKGYAAVAASTAGSAAAPAPAPRPSPAPAPAPASAAPAAAPAPAPHPVPVAVPAATAIPAPIAVAPAAEIAWPQGGIVWTDEALAALPVVRGIHVRPQRPLQALLDEPIAFLDDPHGYRETQLAKMAASLGRRWTRWNEAHCAEVLRRPVLETADAEFWLELLGNATTQALRRPAGTESQHTPAQWNAALRWVAETGAALRGLPFMLEVAFVFARADQAVSSQSMVVQGLLATLREAIAAAPQAEHDAAIATLERIAGDTPQDRLLRAFCCPHRSDWAEAAAAEASAADVLLLHECVLPAPVVRRLLADVAPWLPWIGGALLLQIRLHGSEALDLVAHTLRRASERDSSEKLIALLLAMRDPRVVGVLAELIDRKEVRAALDGLATTYPAAVLKTVLERAFATGSRLAEGWALRMALREPQALAQVQPLLAPADRARLERLQAELQTEDAADDRLPPLLRHPPWLDARRATDLPTFDAAPPALQERALMDEAERARHAAFQPHGWQVGHLRQQGRSTEQAVLDELCIVPAARERVLAGQPLQPQDVVVQRRYFSALPEWLLLLPPAAALAVWNGYPSHLWRTWNPIDAPVMALLAQHGTAALPGLAAYAQAQPADGLRLARVVDSPRLAGVALHALRHLKKARAPAVDWVRTHAATTIAVALSQAFGRDKTLRDNAQHGLRWLLAQGFDAEVRAQAAAAGPPLAAALQALEAADPLHVLPARLPRLPAFFVPAAFRRPRLHDGGGALPVGACTHLGTMLAISRPDAPYAGLEVVRAACTPASLAEFAWDLFEAWLAAGAPAKEAWAFQALGHLGDDETARRLAPRIREWPGEAAHQRAVAGLDLLAMIGSDVALMHLNGIAGKVKFKALQERAREKIAAVAESRGLSAAELGDRLVPDLGLDDDGTLVLDFGPRRFFVGFDEALKPWVKDAAGVRLKDLPKPNRADDAAQAEAAVERFKQIRKDAKAVASLQITRLELAMVQRRRWPAPDFRLFFLQHPLTRHLAARLVWGVYGEDGALQGAFRIAEDRTLADADDALFSLPDEATVGIAHVLEMAPPLQAAFGQVFADYEILQPFRQLGRETYALTEAERADNRITRYADKAVSSGSVLGLVNRGWERGEAQDAGHVGWFSRPVGEGLVVDLELDPGLAIGDPSFEPRQTLPALVLRRPGTWGADGSVPLSQLDPVTASEVLRDIELMAPYKE